MPLTISQKAPFKMSDWVLSAPLCHMYYYVHNEVYLRQYTYSLWKKAFRGVPRN